MRLVSFGEPRAERAGILLADRVVSVASLTPRFPDTVRGILAGGHLPALSQAVRGITRGAGTPISELRLGPPVADAGKIICVGLNYADHAAEQGKEHPQEPLLFAKTTNTLAGCRDDIRYPSAEVALDYEVELAVVIGRRTSRVARAQARDHIAGLMVANDVSARRWQRGDGQWFRGKSCDTFFPCGPALVTLDEVGDIAALRLTTTVNGRVLQDATASLLIHDVPALIEWISRDITLEPGDIISTGTPAGVGCFRTPPVALVPGDEVVCSISGLGEVRNRIAPAA